MKIKLFSLILCVLTVFGVFGGLGVSADDISYADEAQDIIDSIIGYNLSVSGSADVQDWIDTSLADSVGGGSDWYVIALMRDGEYDLSAYRESLLVYAAENRVSSAATSQKYAFILKALGGGEDYISSVAENSIGTQGIMSYVWGLHLLNNGCGGSFTADSVVRQILSMQLDDGGWAVTGGVSDVDVTSMTVQALAPYYGSDDSVQTAVDEAVGLLSARQLDDGDYSSYGVPNPESTAQVIIALSSLGIDCMNDERFVKNGSTLLDGVKKYALADGGFSHSDGGEQNNMATSQVYLALCAYLGMLDVDSGIYILTDSEETAETEIIDKNEKNEDNGKSESVQAEADEVEDVPEETAGASDIEITIPQNSGVSYKIWVSAVIVGAALVVCVILTLAGKRSGKNYIAVIILASAAILFVVMTDFQSADSYYSGESVHKENSVGSVIMSVMCKTVAGLDEHIPADGVVLSPCEFEIAEGDTVYSILTEAARQYGIHLDNSGSDSMAYIAGIANIYEFDFGELSGWMYFVNGEKASVGCGEYVLSDGDIIEWIYSREMGKDLE